MLQTQKNYGKLTTVKPSHLLINVQDREFSGLHRIYCYPFNITIDGTEHKCPDFPFELEGKTNYSVATLEHVGLVVNKDSSTTSDLHMNREIISQLKVEQTKIRALNSTNLTIAYETYYQKLKDLPKKIEFKKVEGLIWEPFKWFKTMFSWIEEWIETIGIILAIGAGIFLIIIAAPIIEFFFIGIGLLKTMYRMYMSVVRRVTNKVRRVQEKRKGNYWEDMQKLV